MSSPCLKGRNLLLYLARLSEYVAQVPPPGLAQESTATARLWVNEAPAIPNALAMLAVLADSAPEQATEPDDIAPLNAALLVLIKFPENVPLIPTVVADTVPVVTWFD